MTFSRQVGHDIGFERPENLGDFCRVADIGLHEIVTIRFRNGCERLEIPGISQCVNIQHIVRGVLDQMAHQSRTDKSGAAGDKDV